VLHDWKDRLRDFLNLMYDNFDYIKAD